MSNNKNYEKNNYELNQQIREINFQLEELIPGTQQYEELFDKKEELAEKQINLWGEY